MRPWAFFVDRLPRLRELRRGADGALILRGLEVAFPAMPAGRRRRLMRASLRQRAYNVFITLVLARLGSIAPFIARAIPARDFETVRELVEGDRPIVLVTFHTGPVYLTLNVIERLCAARRLYAMHQSDGALFDDIVHLLRAISITSVPNTVMAPRTLIKALRTDRRSVAIFACDYSPGSQTVSFLGRTIAAAEGAQLLQASTGADVICAIWERHGIVPSVRFSRPRAVAREGEPGPATIIQAIFDEYEPLVRRAPHRWAAWETFAGRIVTSA